MKIRTASLSATGLALLLSVGIGHASEQEGQPFVMAVLEDQGHGRLVMKGENEDAIEKITRRRDENRLSYEDSMSLCVAYTRTGQFDHAVRVCDMAVHRAASRRDRRRSEERGLGAMTYASRMNYAVAASNRGVLYAVSGDTESAVEAFESALVADPGSDVAKQNLSRIGSY